MKLRPTLLLANLLLTGTHCSLNQIIEMRQAHGQEITCAVSGLYGWEMPCGLDRGYEQVFVGSILTAVPISDRESELSLRPEEVFFGSPDAIVKAKTGQGDCLPDARAGDQWLFFLKKDDDTKELKLWYGSPSGPLDKTLDEVSLLRRLAKQNDSGAVIGSVVSVEEVAAATSYLPVAGHKVIATAKNGGGQFVAVTDDKGDYEFPQLPTGEYHLTSNTKKGLWSEEGSLKVTPHSCASVAFQLHPDGLISGHLREPEGSPGANHWVSLRPNDPADTSFQSTFTDSQGHFEFHGLKPGRYVIGVVGSHRLPDDAPIAYYPGVPDRINAVAVQIGSAEHRLDVDFELPHPKD